MGHSRATGVAQRRSRCYIFDMSNIGRKELLEKLLTLKPAFERGGVTHLVLFGSRARQDNRPDSDIDVMIDVDESRKFSLLDLVGIGHIIEDNIGLPANIFMRRSLDAKFKASTQRDLIQV